MTTKTTRLIFLTIILLAISTNAFALTITAELDNDGNTTTISKEVVETKEFKVTFVPIATEILNPNLNKIYNHNKEFLKATYPISETGFKSELSPIPYIPKTPLELVPKLGLAILLNELVIEDLLTAKFSDKVVGIINYEYLKLLVWGNDVYGASKPENKIAVLIASDQNYLAAHEIGHTYGLCDEYSLTAWNDQNCEPPRTKVRGFRWVQLAHFDSVA